MQTRKSSQSRTKYEADGFYLFPELTIDKAVIQRAIEGMDAVRAGEYETGTPPRPSAWNPGDDPKKLCKIEMSQIANRAIMELVSQPSIGKLAAEITGAQMVQVWWVQLLYKPPVDPDGIVPTNIGWHQDRHYWQAWEAGSELFTAWVALSDVTPAAGPMKFVRGSHKWGYSVRATSMDKTTKHSAKRLMCLTMKTGRKCPLSCRPAGSASMTTSPIMAAVPIFQGNHGGALQSICARKNRNRLTISGVD